MIINFIYVTLFLTNLQSVWQNKLKPETVDNMGVKDMNMDEVKTIKWTRYQKNIHIFFILLFFMFMSLIFMLSTVYISISEVCTSYWHWPQKSCLTDCVLCVSAPCWWKVRWSSFTAKQHKKSVQGKCPSLQKLWDPQWMEKSSFTLFLESKTLR